MKLRVTRISLGFLLLLLSLVQLTLAQTERSPNPMVTDVTTTGGTAAYLPVFNGASTVVNSLVHQVGTTVEITGNLYLPYTTHTESEGVISIGIPFLHNYGPTNSGNVFLGGYAGNFSTTGTVTTGVGYEALHALTTGINNTAVGSYALTADTTGKLNSAVGYAALFHNTTGIQNNAFGDAALASNTTGNGNTAFGTAALEFNTTGGSSSDTAANSAFGNFALYSNTTAAGNAAVGYTALYSNTTGANNTAVGSAALFANTTGSDLTCVGHDCNSGADDLSNATAIGAHAVVSVSNAVVLGGTGKYAVNVGIGTATPTNVLTIERGAGHPLSDGWTTYSSRRWKTNIQTLHGALTKVEQLRGVSYDQKDSGKHEVGVIAEEVGAVVPEVVTWDKNGKDAQSVDYSRLTALLIEATKEQQQEIRSQQAALRTQAAAVRNLESELRAARQTLEKVKAQVNAAQPTLVAVK